MSIVDKARNAGQKAVGQVKKVVGERTGNRDLAAEGKADRVKGSLKNAGENVKDATKP